MVCREKFVTDAMLGKLTRWLRVLGCDTLGFREIGIGDEALLEVAKEENRVLLTKDEALFRRAWKGGLKTHYLNSTGAPRCLAELSDLFDVHLRIEPTTSRCPDCNSELIRMPSELAPSVPEGVMRKHAWAYVCPNCGKAFWLGSHYLNMLKTLSRAKAMKRGRKFNARSESTHWADDESDGIESE